MRIGGLASGLDVDAIVKQLMTAEKIPLNKLNQQKQQMEWKREEYRQLSTKMVSFNEKLSSTYNMSNAIDAKKTNLTGATNVLTARPTGTATNSVLDITVKELASATNVIYRATSSATKMSDIYEGSETSVKIGNATISFTADESIDSFVRKINGNKETGVIAVFDSATGSLSLTSKTTGNDAIKLEGELFMGITDPEDEVTPKPKFSTTGQTLGNDAAVIVNGIETTRASNTFTINGVEITLNAKSPTNQSTQIQVVQDTDKIMETIQSFVTAYNDSLGYLNQKTNEARYRTYLPLTSEEKKELSDDEVKLWEERAKSGMLKNDSILSKAVSDMRTAIISDFSLPNGEKLNLAQFGITTGNYSEKGKLYIDENKLRSALETNPEKVTAIFSQTSSTSPEHDGIFNRIRKANSSALQSMADKAGTSRISSDLNTDFLPQSEMGDQLRNYENRIKDLQDRLNRREKNYFRQFTAMETAMNRYNSTMSSLSSFM